MNPETWTAFTTELVTAAKLTKSEDKAAWATGMATGLASSPFILVFGPVAGYYAGKRVHNKTVLQKAGERLAPEGQISAVLRKWNGDSFIERGFQAYLELPQGSGRTDWTFGLSSGSKTDLKKFRIIVVPNREAFGDDAQMLIAPQQGGGPQGSLHPATSNPSLYRPISSNPDPKLSLQADPQYRPRPVELADTSVPKPFNQADHDHELYSPNN
jgi:hypothetical protein